MPDSLDHLAPDYRAIAQRPNEERIRWILSDRWVAYRVADLIHERLHFLMDYPERGCMPCLFIGGEPGMGTSRIAEKFVRDFPTAFNEGTGATVQPALFVEIPDDPNPDAMREEIFAAVGAPGGSGDAGQLIRILKSLDCRLLVLDEVNKIGDVAPKQQRLCLTAIRTLHNKLRVPIIALGTPDAEMTFRLDPQLAERFETITLPRWTNSEDLRALLLRLAAILPLHRPSAMDDPRFRRLLMDRTEGVTGRIFRLIENVAIEAIRSGRESIDESSLSDERLMLPLVSMVRSRRRASSAA